MELSVKSLLKVDPVARIRGISRCLFLVAERIACCIKHKSRDLHHSALQIVPVAIVEDVLTHGVEGAINQVRTVAPEFAGHLDHLTKKEEADKKAAAITKLQRMFRGNNHFWRRVAHHNIATLKANLLQHVSKSKSLGREDFLLIFR